MELHNTAPEEEDPCPPAYCITPSASLATSYRQPTVPRRAVTFRIEQPRERLRCSQCGSEDVWVRGHEERTFRTVPIGSKPTFVTLDVARVCCSVCDNVRQVKIAFADPKKRYTRSFERYALDLSRHMTIQDVAEHLQVSWDIIKDIQAKRPATPLRQAQAAQAQADRHR